MKTATSNIIITLLTMDKWLSKISQNSQFKILNAIKSTSAMGIQNSTALNLITFLACGDIKL
ncbi:Membrane-flanked domain-containing protein (fragment) [Staphylococcus aureus]